MVFRPYQWKRSAEIPLRTSVGNRISANLGIPVYSGTAGINAKNYPYVIMGDAEREEWPIVKTDNGDSIRLSLHIYTQEPGYDQVNGYTDLLLRAFGAPLQIEDNWQIVYAGLESGSMTYRQGADIAHAVLYIRFKLWDESY